MKFTPLSPYNDLRESSVSQKKNVKFYLQFINFSA